MIQVRKSEERGHGDHGWLKSQFSFSFAEYYDPAHMGFRALRVINEDHIAGGAGFPMHPHRDMEIISYVASGALQHKDSHGNVAVIRPGEVQRMSAGSGVTHSEYNASPTEEAHLFQIWIVPNQSGTPFGYGQKSFEKEIAEKNLVLTVSGSGRDGSISIQQDADLYVSRLGEGEQLGFELREGRHAWLQMVRGALMINGHSVEKGDGAAISGETVLKMAATRESEFLLFDLA